MKTNISFSSEISKENSFDFLRLFFAFAVFVSHFSILTATKIYFPISSAMAVAGFFTISGFLIMRSFYRSKNIWDYFQKRIRRIVPAYLLIVVLCAFLFSFISSLSLNEYFTSKTFFKYLICNGLFLNFLQPTLPEIFITNALPFVNASLWTIKVELCLYAILPLIAVILKKKPIFVLVGIYIFAVLYSLFFNYLAEKTGNSTYEFLERQFPGQLRFFISGVIILFYFDFIKNKLKWFLPIVAMVFIVRYFINISVIEFLFPISFAILIIFCAYYFKKLSIFTKFGDLSYGFYLFHFPVIQLFVHFGILKENPVLLFIACFAVIYFLSFLSWHFLEKRILKRSNSHLPI
jgi:peptidoglycan/LPS O-acetylase OafA/YrhL